MDCYWLQEQLKTESYAGEYPQSSIMKLPVGGARKHARKQDRNTITEVISSKRTSGSAINSYGRQSGQTANNSRNNTGRSNFIETDVNDQISYFRKPINQSISSKDLNNKK